MIEAPGVHTLAKVIPSQGLLFLDTIVFKALFFAFISVVATILIKGFAASSQQVLYCFCSVGCDGYMWVGLGDFNSK